MEHRMRRFALLALAAATLIVPESALASPHIRFGIQDDAWLQSGSLDGRLAVVDKLGPDVLRYTLRWDLIARAKPKRATNPNDLAYDWRIADSVLKGLRAHQVQVLVCSSARPSGRMATMRRTSRPSASGRWPRSPSRRASATRLRRRRRAQPHPDHPLARRRSASAARAGGDRSADARAPAREVDLRAGRGFSLRYIGRCVSKAVRRVFGSVSRCSRAGPDVGLTFCNA
jgi:hypothetical protein